MMTTKNFSHDDGGPYDSAMLPVLLLHVALAMPPTSLTADSLYTAIAEADAIWSAHGVTIRLAPATGSLPADAIVVRIAIARRPSSHTAGSSGALGSIDFDGTGTPIPVITLYLRELIEMIAGSNGRGSGGDFAPMILRERAIGRAVGRVLAHELGHYLLCSRAHQRSGLMRAVHTAADLAGPDRGMFSLSRQLAAIRRPLPGSPAAGAPVSPDGTGSAR
jgi:hypothetical protein